MSALIFMLETSACMIRYEKMESAKIRAVSYDKVPEKTPVMKEGSHQGCIEPTTQACLLHRAHRIMMMMMMMVQYIYITDITDLNFNH